ncbi:hypothetical protein [Leptospira interrogans]|uniref:Uncharacterized protein n=2 Tax=Leptospira interrogans TaxID=173 RepID=A0A0F6I819_LEPIR|nr:hypothetical protein [Leptospira interrogans]EMF43394.1 hypothetical protein LEP1GSC067_3344 [Leptospira interrogans serovar Lora str. TE 1992]AKH77388.1 hypothetical protein BRAT_10205 [Leptospira interrogans serovar Bratislava]EMJ34194.1 hypothetical protein LEP1GSC079_2066 [Leptospira interrogans str. FPW1039]EMN10119.1 hypothetical protein LEP1GSC053_3956 [Leptospira interrogans serovar Muenchen str. Brem 129]EMN53797.1 hypothetical protein LEP1GSC089_3412 [Leptospira interrogans serova
MNSDKSIVPGGISPNYKNALQNLKQGQYAMIPFNLGHGLTQQIRKHRNQFVLIGEFVNFLQSHGLNSTDDISDINQLFYSFRGISQYLIPNNKFSNYILETCRIILNTHKFTSFEQLGELIQCRAIQSIFQKECVFRDEAKDLRQKSNELKIDSIPEKVHKLNLGWWKTLGPFKNAFRKYSIQNHDEDLTS